MANINLTNFYRIGTMAVNQVSREQVGMISAVTKSTEAAEKVTLNQAIRVPVVPAMSASDIAASNVALTEDDRDIDHEDVIITKQHKVSWHLTAEKEKGMMLGDYNNDINMQSVAQAMRTLSNEIEVDLCSLYKDASRAYGTLGTTPFDSADNFTDATRCMKILDDNGAPKIGRSIVLNTDSVATLLGKQPSVFRTNEAGTEMSQRYGELETLFGFRFAISNHFAEHVKGDATQAINKGAGFPVGDTELTIDGGGGTEHYNHSDIITLAGDTNKYVVADDSGNKPNYCQYC